MTTAIREHLMAADRQARQHRSAESAAALGIAYHSDLFHAEAVAAYRAAEAIDPQDWRWPYYRALAQLAGGDAAAASAALERVVALAPDAATALWRLGDADFKQRRYDRAEAAWRRARAITAPAAPGAPVAAPGYVGPAPVAAFADWSLARLALIRDDAELARALLEPLTATSPRFGPALRLLGAAYSALNRPEEAARAIRRADALVPYALFSDPHEDALARTSRSSTYLLQKAKEADFASNAQWHEFLVARALGFDPANPDVVFAMGLLRRAQNRNLEALAYFRRTQELEPEDANVRVQTALSLAAAGRAAEAESLLRSALTTLDDAEVHYNLGAILMGGGRRVEAIREYEQALVRDPAHLSARTNLAALLADDGQLNAAREQIERAIAVNPDNAMAHANLGVVLLRLNRHAEAGHAFQEALVLDPSNALAARGLRAAGY